MSANNSKSENGGKFSRITSFQRGWKHSPWTLLDIMYWFLTAIYCSTQSYLFTAETWIIQFVPADNQRREKVHFRPQPENFKHSIIHKINGDTVIIFKVFSVMKVLQWNEFPGWIRLIQSLIAYRKCCKAFTVDLCYIQNLFAVISKGEVRVEPHIVQTQLKRWEEGDCTVAATSQRVKPQLLFSRSFRHWSKQTLN